MRWMAMLVCVLPACYFGATDVSPEVDAAADADDDEIPDAGPDAEVGVACVTPVAACDDGFMWQGRQDRFLSAGVPVSGEVAIGVLPGDTGAPFFCYARADGELVCHGTLAGTTYSLDTPAGVSDVVQILTGGWSDLCAVQRGGTAWCIGTYNDHGQLGNDSTAPAGTFVEWGTGAAEPIGAIAAMGTGTGDTFCALTTSGLLWCAGFAIGAGEADSRVPVRVAIGVAAFYQDTFGMIRYRATTGDPFWFNPMGDSLSAGGFDACRVSNGRAEYKVTTAGVVDGGRVGAGGPDGPLCILGNNGLVTCGLTQTFDGARVLAIGANLYLDTDVFAIRTDGAVIEATGAEISPPGSARVPACQ